MQTLRTAVGLSILGCMAWGMVVHPLYTIGVCAVFMGMRYLVGKARRIKRISSTTVVVSREEVVAALGEDVVRKAEGDEPHDPLVLELRL